MSGCTPVVKTNVVGMGNIRFDASHNHKELLLTNLVSLTLERLWTEFQIITQMTSDLYATPSTVQTGSYILNLGCYVIGRLLCHLFESDQSMQERIKRG